MNDHFDFKKMWEITREKVFIEDGEGDKFIGAMQIKDAGKSSEYIINEWVRQFPFYKFRGDERERLLFKRFLTYQEYQEVFSETLGKQVEGIGEEDDNLGFFMTELKGGLSKALAKTAFKSYKKGQKDNKDYEKFFALHPAFELFNILSDGERKDFVSMLKASRSGESRYFHAMKVSSPDIGDFFLRKKYFRIPHEYRKKHTYLIGATGSGKSELLKSLVRQDFLQGDSAVIVLDPKGDFGNQIARFKENFQAPYRDRLVFIDPTLSRTHFPTINPFDIEVDDGDLDKVVGRLDALINRLSKQDDYNFTATQQTMLFNMLHTLYRRRGSSLLDLQRFLDKDRNHDLVALGQSSNNPVISSYFENSFIKQIADFTKEGIIGRMTKILQTQLVQNFVTGKSTLDLKKAINEKKLIIFNLNKGSLGEKTAATYGVFILGTLLNIMLARSEKHGEKLKERVPCHVYLDEFQDYALGDLSIAITQGRGFEFCITIATQSTEADIPKELQRAITGNVGIKIVGRAGDDSKRKMTSMMSIKKDNELGVTIDTLDRLTVGEFVAQIDVGEPFKFKSRTKTLDNKHSMSSEQWDEIVQEQIKKYYDDKRPKPIQENEGSSFPNPPKRRPVKSATKTQVSDTPVKKVVPKKKGKKTVIEPQEKVSVKKPEKPSGEKKREEPPKEKRKFNPKF